MANLHRAFGFVLRSRRKLAGLSQEALAARSGIHRTYISAVELGKVRLGLEAAKQLADGLGIPLAVLVDEAENLSFQSGEADS